MLETALRAPPEPHPPVRSAHAPISAAAATRCLLVRASTRSGSNLAALQASTGHTTLGVVSAPAGRCFSRLLALGRPCGPSVVAHLDGGCRRPGACSHAPRRL